ncbi:MAG: TRAP transporter small permease [Proteobacteria bacterium]|nr:TRAP transporter small permease [Pseudomonadota bacterium]
MNEAASRGPNLGHPIIGTADDADVRLSDYRVEDWVAFGFFWFLAIVVFLQFFTRYVLNDSLAWTEEIARYLLICVTFIGAGMAARKNSHIHVEFFYLYLGRKSALALSTLVDVLRVLFFAYATWLAWKVTLIMDTQRMVVIDWPMSYVFGAGFVGFAIMTVRSAQVGARHWRDGASALTRVHDEGRHQ